MFENTALINGMLNAAIIEILATVEIYMIFKIFLEVMDINKRKYIFMIVSVKVFVFNMIMSYIKYTQVNDAKLNKMIFLANTIAMVLYVGGIKIVTQNSYLHIGITVFSADFISTLVVVMPYLCGSFVWESNEAVFVGEDINYTEIFSTIIVIAIICLLIYLSQYLLRWLYKKLLIEGVKNKVLWWIFIACGYMYGNWGYARNDVIKGNVIMIYYIIVPIIGVLCLYEISLWLRKLKERQIQQENHILSIENAVMKEYYETLEYQLERTRKFRHDIDKHMTVIKEMLSMKENGGEIINYASNVQSEYQNLKPIEYCKNPVVNAILVNKVRQCEEMGIETNIDISRFELGEIKETDIIAVLANVLDNAIEECSRLTNKDKRVELKCDMYAENLIIKVSNSTEKREVKSDVMKTKKKDTYAHGVGLEIVKEIVVKYNGTLELDVKDDMFNVIIGMNTNE